MPHAPIGTVWSVLGYEDAAVVVLAGPFATNRGAPEYLIAPLYTGREPGFVWTEEDIRLESSETGLQETCFAAIWNARPILDADLSLQLSTMNEDATVAIRDAYWASLNERPLGKSPRLGRAIRNPDDPAAVFQASELKRWTPVSGRAFDPPEPSSARVTARCGDIWTMTLPTIDMLTSEMASSESLVGSISLEGIGQFKAWLRSPLQLSHSPDVYIPDDLFVAASSVRFWYEAAYVIDQDASQRPHVALENAANSELADAA